MPSHAVRPPCGNVWSSWHGGATSNAAHSAINLGHILPEQPEETGLSSRTKKLVVVEMQLRQIKRSGGSDDKEWSIRRKSLLRSSSDCRTPVLHLSQFHGGALHSRSG